MIVVLTRQNLSDQNRESDDIMTSLAGLIFKCSRYNYCDIVKFKIYYTKYLFHMLAWKCMFCKFGTETFIHQHTGMVNVIKLVFLICNRRNT